MSKFLALIDRGDLDGLIRIVDDLCYSREWHELLHLRNSCRSAAASGKQLWPVSTLAEYRLALHAPAHIAVQVLDESSGRFTIGPLTEVIAQHHQWTDLQRELPHSPIASYAAHECAMRGQCIDNAHQVFNALEIPFEIQAWEPPYELAVYHDNAAEFPSPTLPPSASGVLQHASNTHASRHDQNFLDAVHQLIGSWISSSSGTLQLGAVTGDQSQALASIGVQSATVRSLPPATALALLAWAGASGGAHGRRRGAAAGRDSAWWLLGAFSEKSGNWPPSNDEVGDILHSLEWSWFDTDAPSSGWQLQLLVTDPNLDLSWAISGHDSGA